MLQEGVVEAVELVAPIPSGSPQHRQFQTSGVSDVVAGQGLCGREAFRVVVAPQAIQETQGSFAHVHDLAFAIFACLPQGAGGLRRSPLNSDVRPVKELPDSPRLPLREGYVVERQGREAGPRLGGRCSEHQEYSEELIDLRNAGKGDASREHLSVDASRRPHVHCSCVELLAKQQFGRLVPQGHQAWGVRPNGHTAESRQCEVRQLHARASIGTIRIRTRRDQDVIWLHQLPEDLLRVRLWYPPPSPALGASAPLRDCGCELHEVVRLEREEDVQALSAKVDEDWCGDVLVLQTAQNGELPHHVVRDALAIIVFEVHAWLPHGQDRPSTP
eukprot:scaffold194_cov277-Pinguiococcus_pyrenoidosus.AAC.18